MLKGFMREISGPVEPNDSKCMPQAKLYFNIRHPLHAYIPATQRK